MSPSAFPDSPKGRLVRQFIDAYNAGEGPTLEFWKNSFASKISVEQRLERYRKLRSNIGDIAVIRVLPDSAGSIEVLVRSAKGENLKMMFRVTQDPKPQITGVGIEQTDGEEPAAEPKVTPRAERAVLDDIRRLVETKSKVDEFSGTILIARGHEVILEEAYGLANRNFGIANTLATRFDIGSIVKSFTRVAVGQLIQGGRLHLDDKLGQFLPDYPNQVAREKVTIGQLLEMRSGIGDFFGPKFERTSRGDLRSLKDYLPLFASEPLAFAPGTDRAYSNGGYIVLGMIIEKITGQSYYDYVQQHIFDPAGMKSTDFSFSDMPHDHEATGYSKESESGFKLPPRTLRANVLMLPARGSSAGSARSTTRDLLLYSQALAGDVLIKEATAEQLGIGRASIGVAGGAPGLNAVLETGIPSAGASEYTVIIMSNYDPPAAEGLGREVRSLLRSAK
jgi:D-alanyl-D-alanine carboxypeptidase